MYMQPGFYRIMKVDILAASVRCTVAQRGARRITVL